MFVFLPVGTLNDASVGIFRDAVLLRLRRATVRRCCVSREAFLLAICPHRLQELDASWVSGGLTGAAVVSALASSDQCRSSLHTLSLSGLLLDWASLGETTGFGSLQGLRKLNLSNTDLGDAALQDVSTLGRLESLDISCSAVTQLTPLLGCRNTLRSLVAHCLRRLDMPPAGLLDVLGQLCALRHLDLSEDHSAVGDSDGRDGSETVQQLLEAGPDLLPSLVSLDISGRRRVSEAAVAAFVQSRSRVVFLGLLATGTSSCDAVCAKKELKVSGHTLVTVHRSSLLGHTILIPLTLEEPWRPTALSSPSLLLSVSDQVTGEANETQVCEALRRYQGRECFVQEALVHLYNLVIDISEARPDMLKVACC